VPGSGATIGLRLRRTLVQLYAIGQFLNGNYKYMNIGQKRMPHFFTTPDVLVAKKN